MRQIRLFAVIRSGITGKHLEWGIVERTQGRITVRRSRNEIKKRLMVLNIEPYCTAMRDGVSRVRQERHITLLGCALLEYYASPLAVTPR